MNFSFNDYMLAGSYCKCGVEAYHLVADPDPYKTRQSICDCCMFVKVFDCDGRRQLRIPVNKEGKNKEKLCSTCFYRLYKYCPTEQFCFHRVADTLDFKDVKPLEIVD